MTLSEQYGPNGVQMFWMDFLTSLYFMPKDKASALLLKYFQSKVHYLKSANNFKNILRKYMDITFI